MRPLPLLGLMLKESVQSYMDFVKNIHGKPADHFAEATAQLQRLQAQLPILDLDDLQTLSELRTCARRALEAMGFQLPGPGEMP